MPSILEVLSKKAIFVEMRLDCLFPSIKDAPVDKRQETSSCLPPPPSAYYGNNIHDSVLRIGNGLRGWARVVACFQTATGSSHMSKRSPSYLGGGTIVGPKSDWRVFGGRKGCLGENELLWAAVQAFVPLEDWFSFDTSSLDSAVMKYGVEIEAGVKAQVQKAGGLKRWMEQHPRYAQCLSQARRDFKAGNSGA